MSLMANPEANFATLFTLGATGYSIGEVGETLTAVNAANRRGGDAQAIVNSFDKMALRAERRAAAADAAGHVVTARENRLRGANYRQQSLFFVLGTDRPQREADEFASMKRDWLRAAAAFPVPIDRVDIPYGRSSMPGYLIRPDTSGKPRPTVIVNNGSDGQSIWTYAWGGRAAVDRGWNALLLEGPGQGEMLFERKIPFRPDWEAVITPVVNYLQSRPDVDQRRIILSGWSMGGILVSRAAAFEHRLAALICDPGGVNAFAAFPATLRKIANAGSPQVVNRLWRKEVVRTAKGWEAFSLKKRLEIFSTKALEQARQGRIATDFYGLSRSIMQIRSHDVAHRITAPTLVLDYEDEGPYPGQAKKLYDLLTVSKKDLVRMPADVGAQYHDAPMAPQYRNEVVYDWLADTLHI
jgi:predicted alpha/beta-fold hydrolase